MTTPLIKETLKQLPESPGCYIMRGARNNILYVGKAVNLRNRVRSYFNSQAGLTPKTRAMVAQINDFEFFVVSSEQEALILELNLIKRYWPPYNVLLKDDKTFPYLKISLKEPWPRLHITRRLEEDGSHYFGPFASMSSLRCTVDVLKRIFPLRSCKEVPEPGPRTRPCLKFHMGYCPAPCSGNLKAEDYQNSVAQVIHFLEGKHEVITRAICKKMTAASENLNFEQAARFRDQLKALEAVVEGQKIAMKVRGEQDAIAFYQEHSQTCVQVFIIRRSKLIGREHFILKNTESEEPTQIMTSFLQQFYSASPYIPPLLLLQHPVENSVLIEEWLSQKKGSSVTLEVPLRGKKKQLIDIVAENARQSMEQVKIKQLSLSGDLPAALAEVQTTLNLPDPPSRMEAYDISNIQGTDAVGSMVVFIDGKPKNSEYRRFKIKMVEGANDYGMLQEMLRRRFKRAAVKDDQKPETKWAVLPDLVLIDGGKGQLNAAKAVMEEQGVTDLPLASLAKENEEIFMRGRPDSIKLPDSSPGLRLLQRLRDEAHRFAITYFKSLHGKRAFASALDQVSGIGPVRKKALIKQFGSVHGIRSATLEELTAVKGINLELAIQIKQQL